MKFCVNNYSTVVKIYEKQQTAKVINSDKFRVKFFNNEEFSAIFQIIII